MELRLGGLEAAPLDQPVYSMVSSRRQFFANGGKREAQPLAPNLLSKMGVA
jgi:hypothetical protein